MRVGVGDLVSYMFGSVELIGVVLKVTRVTKSMWGGPKRPEFTMRLLEIDGYISDWDVWHRDVIVILSEARRPGKDQVLDDSSPMVSVRDNPEGNPWHCD